MLVDVDFVENEICQMIAKINDNNPITERIKKGIYVIGHFSFNHMIYLKEEYPQLKNIGCYGVCDTYKQILEKEPDIEKSNRKFVISLTPIEKKYQSKKGGWRWHKWGSYIGVQNPTSEYLYDEPEIEKVYVYHIYEV